MGTNVVASGNALGALSAPITIGENGTFDLYVADSEQGHYMNTHNKKFIISGHGFDGQGAICNSGPAPDTKPRVHTIELTADSTIKAQKRWDLRTSTEDYHGRRGIVIDKYPKRLEVSNPGTLRMSKSVAIAGGTSDARNGKIFNIFSLVRIGERSGMGLSSLYGVWEKEKFAEPSIVESYEPDRTKVMVEFEADESELGVEIQKLGEHDRPFHVPF